MNKEAFRIIFMGTPEFAVPSLKAIIDAGYSVPAVITAPDKPSGRGKKMTPPAIKVFAEEQGIEVLQPVKLKDPIFLEELKALNPHLQVVVAFRMLPQQVWNLPQFGTINLHAALLPQYRGAAPINHAVMNGESKTGLTTFFLDQEIDTGKIILRKEMEIGPNETAGELHDRMMVEGADILLETIELIRLDKVKPLSQAELLANVGQLKPAPKIFKEDCLIDWNEPGLSIFNKIRGLSPFPTAYSILETNEGETHLIKIYKTEFESTEMTDPPGSIRTDNKTFLKVAAPDGYIFLKELQLAGKKKLPINDFLRGFHPEEDWKFVQKQL
ncbi:MAG: methionyl-tRNA formyltransferase [Bacteroidales bacterium]|nr:methionyl-tRNA formyltransferase [Bacteroidales bacterium]